MGIPFHGRSKMGFLKTLKLECIFCYLLSINKSKARYYSIIELNYVYKIKFKCPMGN